MAFSADRAIDMSTSKDVEPPVIATTALVARRLIDACVYLFPLHGCLLCLVFENVSVVNVL